MGYSERSLGISAQVEIGLVFTLVHCWCVLRRLDWFARGYTVPRRYLSLIATSAAVSCHEQAFGGDYGEGFVIITFCGTRSGERSVKLHEFS